MSKVPYGSKPKPKPRKNKSLWDSVTNLIQTGIDHTAEVVKQDKARQKELSGLRALNAEYSRRKDDYMGIKLSLVALSIAATIGITVWIEPETWLNCILVGMIVGTCVMVATSGLMWWVEDKLIVRDMRKEGWPIPPK